MLFVGALLVTTTVWACPFGTQKDDKSKNSHGETKAQVLAKQTKTVKADGKAGVK
jgi:hypothetical protein